MNDERPRIPSLDWLALWILFSAWCPLSGWSLSLLGCLNRAGVGVSLIFFVACLILLRRPLGLLDGARSPRSWKLSRSRRLLPQVWLLLTALSFIGGLAYAPTNYDYLTYRFPRLLYWCWEQKWCWISTGNARMNFSGTEFEWLMSPSFILFKTDRLFFLINFIPYLFLPGLIFSVFRGLGISRRISWWWMWVLPCGYCYILQAPSAGNDSYATVYFLASLHYLFRAKGSVPTKHLALSCLSIALLTGAKASNLPLVLPWLVVLYFNRGHLLGKVRPASLAPTLLVAAMASFLPIALLNHHYTGDYFGDPTNRAQMKVNSPVAGLVGNSLQLATDNLAPPLWPRPITWQPWLPVHLKEMLARDFPRLLLGTEEMQIEEDAGAGLGIVLSVILFLAAGAWAAIAGRSRAAPRSRQALWVAGAMAVACLAYLLKMGSESASRLVAAYYPLIVASVLVLVPLDGRIIHRRLFKGFGFLVMLSAFPLIILSPARPLFPAQWVVRILKNHASPAAVERFNGVYGVYALRPYAFQELTAILPPQDRIIGFVQGGNDAETSLWRPFGARKLVEVTPADSLDEVKALGIHCVVVSQEALEYNYHTTIADLVDKWSARLVVEKGITLTAHKGRQTWYVLSLDKA